MQNVCFPGRAFRRLLNTSVLFGLLLALSACGAGEAAPDSATPSGSSASTETEKESAQKKNADGEPGDAESADSARTEESTVLVRLGDFERGPISRRLPVSADLEAIREADVVAEVAGIVSAVLVEEGGEVKEGQTVLQLNDEELDLVLQNKRILLDQAISKRDEAKLALIEIKAQREQKKLLFDEAEAALDRSVKLSGDDEGIVSAEEVDVKRFARDRAQLDVDALELQVKKTVLLEAQSEQGMKLAEVELKQAELNVRRCEINAPIAGHISVLDLKIGENVTTSTVVFHIVDASALRAQLHVPQRELRRLSLNQSVNIHTDVYPGENFPGKLTVISPVVNKDNGTVKVTVEVEGSGKLRPGMFVSGEIVLDRVEEALLVSKRAVSYENQEPVLFLVQGEVARRYVLIPGYTDKDHIQVTALVDHSGTEMAEPPLDARLVLIGHNNLEEGARVDVEAPPEDTAGSNPLRDSEIDDSDEL